MWLMKAPEESAIGNSTGFCYGLSIVNGHILVDKQYWYKFLKDRKFIDVTPGALKDVHTKDPKKMLVIRWGGYGDLLMCLPAISELKKRYPDLKVTMAGMDRHVRILKDHPLVDNVIIPPAHQIGNLVNEYDLVYDLSGIIPSNVEADYKNAYDIHLEWFGIDPDSVDDKDKIPDIVVTDDEEKEVREALSEQGITDDDFVIYFNAESSTELRNLPFDKARKAIELLALKYPDAKIIVPTMHSKIKNYGRFTCNKCKKENIVAIKGPIGDHPVKHKCFICDNEIQIVAPDYTGRKKGQFVTWHTIPNNVYFPVFNIRQVCAAILRSDLVITVDSAPLHIAGGLDRPTLGIFSSFDGDLRARYFRNTTWIQSPFRCAPCFQHNVRCIKLRTEKRTFAPCMDNIAPELICAEASKLFDQVRSYRPCETIDDFETDIIVEKPTPADLQEGSKKCFACSSGNIKRSFRKGELSYWLCKDCGSLYIDPLPDMDYFIDNYQDSDYNIIFKGLSGVRKVAQTITTGFGQQFGFEGKLLEIGSNIGWFLEEAKRLGWNCTGVEVSKASVAECRKRGLQKQMITGSIENGEVYQKVEERGPFDLIVIHSTIEHVLNPKALLQTLIQLAHKDSIFSISTPCTDFWNGHNTWPHINPFFAGEHCNLLSKSGMQLLAERCGLKIIREQEQPDHGEIWYLLMKA